MHPEGGLVSMMPPASNVPNTPRRIQRRRTKGWRMPPGARYVGRGDREGWGNPFRVGHEVSIVDYEPGRFYSSDTWGCAMPITPQLAVDLYRAWLLCRPAAVEAAREDLAGVDLACWCPLEDAQGNHVPCHADVLLEIANGGAV